MKNIQAITGMKDLLPGESPQWQFLEDTIKRVLHQYSYKEIRFPIVEQTQLFQRGIGEATDIVEKEMYTFQDRNGDSLTMRPEGTAGCVRACEQHQMLYDRGVLTQKLWYSGPMFRYEKPQKGRLRQFHQFGVEAFGFDGPDIDAEILAMLDRLWRDLGIREGLELQINSLGNAESRGRHREALLSYLESHRAQLDEDSQRRLTTNPLRVFDSKVESTQDLLKGAPLLTEFLDDESREHFEQLKALLDAYGLSYTVNPSLVRGLDYYSKTVFEWVTDRLGAQGTVCGGGRYDGLVEQLGGRATPAIGFGMGVERLVLLLREMQAFPDALSDSADIYVVAVGNVKASALKLAEDLRNQNSNWRVQTHLGGGGFRAQMKKADKSNATFALILGEDEVAQRKVGVKYLREERDQLSVDFDQLATVLLQEF